MRVYIPATLALQRQLVDDGEMRPRSGTAFAVTPALREAYAEGGEDELAEVAIAEAAMASMRLLAAEGGAEETGLPLRRVVVVADANAEPRPDLDTAVVRLSGPVGLDAVAAVYVDNPDAESAVTAAVAVIDEADLGDEDAELTVGDAQDHDLAWYATQELPFLLDLL